MTTAPAFLESAWSAQDLSCRRGERSLFRGLSFTLAPGRLSEVTGPNGSGKSTLLRLLAGFCAADEGRISTARGESAEARAGACAYLGHRDGLKAPLTPRETLRFSAELAGRVADVNAALSDCGLAAQADLPCAYLSAGQRRRLALARLAVLHRPVWLLDEPLAALDEAGRALLRTRLSAHLAQGGLAAAATHDPILPGAAQIHLSGA